MIQKNGDAELEEIPTIGTETLQRGGSARIGDGATQVVGDAFRVVIEMERLQSDLLHDRVDAAGGDFWA